MEETIFVKSETVSFRPFRAVAFALVGLILICATLCVGGIFEGHNTAEAVCFWVSITATAALILIGIVRLYLHSVFIVVGNKRIVGVLFGRQVDIPVDSVTSVSTGIFGRIKIKTASEKISFMGIRNRDAIREIIGDLLRARQPELDIGVRGIW